MKKCEHFIKLITHECMCAYIFIYVGVYECHVCNTCKTNNVITELFLIIYVVTCDL